MNLNQAKKKRPVQPNFKAFKPISIHQLLILIVIHVILAFAMSEWMIVSTFHAVLTLMVGIFISLTSRDVSRSLYAAGYIVGCEVLWRMTEADILWEYGKYSVAIILIVTSFRKGIRMNVLPILYFILLLPSIFLYLNYDIDSSVFKKHVSFNLSGPFLLMVACSILSKVKLSNIQLEKLFITMLLPIVSILTIASFKTFTAEEIYFQTTSLDVTSGGYGPNQVSSMLGFGALLTFWYLMMSKRKPFLKLVLFVLGILLASQCALTFSRGGLYCAGLSAIAASFYLATSRKVIGRYIITLSLVMIAANYVVIPKLIDFTDGAISQRFQETSLTGRDSIMKSDIETWKNHFVFGVGPGMSKNYRPDNVKGITAHTEFSRLLAEHGLLGLIAFLVLFVFGVRVFLRSKTRLIKALSLSMPVWAVAFMVTAGMRLAAPSFIFALCALSVYNVEEMLKRKPVQTRIIK